jgi:hypothetical protein
MAIGVNALSNELLRFHGLSLVIKNEVMEYWNAHLKKIQIMENIYICANLHVCASNLIWNSTYFKCRPI